VSECVCVRACVLREGRVSSRVFHVPLRDRIALGTSEVVTQACVCVRDSV